VRRELEDAAVVRELHVYGNEVGVGLDAEEEFQHRGFGRRLLGEAERRARDAGFDKLAVISGIGVRQYYREKLGYYQDGPYVSTAL
jgi:elongator complex protein 3